MRRVISYSLLVIFLISSIILEHLLWPIYGWCLIIQIQFVLVISTLGENIVSSQGYYTYTKKRMNGPFARNVPLWIPMMWLTVVHASFLIPLVVGLDELTAVMLSGIIASTFDWAIIEPLMSRELRLWEWRKVEKGYFHFVPEEINRFTAPFGNYLTWFLFVGMANFLLISIGMFV